MEELRSDQLGLLKKIYEDGLYIETISTTKELSRLLDSLTNLDLIWSTKQRFTYRISPRGIIALANYSFSGQLVKILEEFLFTYDGKIVWNLDDLKTFVQDKKTTEKLVAMSLQFGEDLGYIRCNYGLGERLPYSLEITIEGEKYGKNPQSLLSYVALDERLFKTNYADSLIISWLHESANGTEDFELEFKRNIPSASDIRRTVSGFSNHLSGILAIGFYDNGRVFGLDDPDDVQRKVFDATSGMINLDLKKRVLMSKEDKKGLIVMVARGNAPVLINDTMIIRDGSSYKNANAREVLECQKRMMTTQNGHLWLNSLRNFRFIQ